MMNNIVEAVDKYLKAGDLVFSKEDIFIVLSSDVMSVEYRYLALDAFRGGAIKTGDVLLHPEEALLVRIRP